MYCSVLWLLAGSASKRRSLRYAILRLDFMAAFAVGVQRRGSRIGHGRVHGEVAVGLKLPVNIGDQSLVLSGRQPFFLQQEVFETRDWIALAPVLEQRPGNILGS